MQKVHFSIFINAPREKVWNTMLEKQTYEKWTQPFSPGSTYEGNWDEGSKIIFLSGESEDKEGMFSRIKENRPHEFVSIEHVGMIKNGVVDTESEEVKKWARSNENYTFVEKDGGTEVLVDIDVPDEYKNMFDEMWPKSLGILKDLSEK